LDSVRRQLAAEPSLPFSRLLDADLVTAALRESGVAFRDRLYPPWVTVWIFLSQVLDPMQCCRQAVLRFAAWRSANGQSACSTNTGAYCQARQRLPEAVAGQLARRVANQLHRREAPRSWRWKGRPVKIADGTTVTMPDTAENQAAYPQPKAQRPGCGFPLARLVVVFSLSVGTVLEMVIGQYKGKQTGEVSLLRALHDSLEPGDILLGDRLYGGYFDIALPRDRGVDVVTRLHQQRRADFRRGRRLGRGDHVVEWDKPPRPGWMDKETHRRLPPRLTVRETRVSVTIPGFRSEAFVVVSTLLDAAHTAGDLADLYRARWQAELDLRSLKQTLQMDVLRGRTPEMVRLEIQVHLLAYNLVRQVMADAAEKHGVLPRQISFTATLQALLAFMPYLAMMTPEQAGACYSRMLDAIAQHRVGNRPDRVEPRKRKRRPKPYDSLNVPRQTAREQCRKKKKPKP